jgi:hypothetical protein
MYETLNTRASSVTSTTMQQRTQPNSITTTLAYEVSWMDRIVLHRTTLADMSHQLKTTAHDRKWNKSKDVSFAKEKKIKGSNTERDDESGNANDLMVDVSILYEAVVDMVRDIGVRGLLFEVLSNDFEYYVYSDESNDSEDNDDDYSEVDAYWKHCYKKHGVGKGCNEWDVWWTYHYIGAILTDMLLEDHELLWDGSSGETIRTAIGSGDEGSDVAMAELLDKIHLLQASLPYVTQSSFHAQHALIWRYVERSSGRLSASYPWELALNFCRGDGSRPKGIVGRPVEKGIDHECFHGFGHAMFYAVASRQLGQQQNGQSKSKPKQHPNEEAAVAAHIFLRPHGGFELSPKSYCEIHELCKGASPPTKERRAMDPNDEASSNSYRICFEGVVHSIRLISEDSPQWADKEKAIEIVSKEMKRCSRKKPPKIKGGDDA